MAIRLCVNAGLIWLLIWAQSTIAQSPRILWSFDTYDSSFGQSAAGDIDGDGWMELVFGCYRNDSSIYALNAENGGLLWKYNAHAPNAEGCNDVAPLIFDVTGSDEPEVLVPASCNPVTYCFNGADGEVIWESPTHGSDSPPTIADVDNDGDLEMLHGEFGGYVKGFEAATGVLEWEISVDANSWIQTAPTIVDLNMDGQLDFVVSTWNFNNEDSIYAFRGDTQEKLWSYPIGDVMYHGTAVADLDGDDYPELLVGSYNDTLYCINGEDGSTYWKYRGGGGYVGAPATLGDLDNDGSCDVVLMSGSRVIALEGNGSFKWQYTIPQFGQAFRGCALADITEDQYPDVIFGTTTGVLYALRGENGSVIWTKDLAADYGNQDFALDHAPLIADFNGDDSLDVFIVGGYSTYPDFENNFGRAYMLTAGKGNGPDWLMFQRDERRQSSLCGQEAVSIALNPERHPDLLLYPNPSRDQVNFSPSGSMSKFRSMRVFSITGSELSISVEPGQRGGEGSFSVEGWPTGIYLVEVRLKNGEIIRSRLLVE